MEEEIREDWAEEAQDEGHRCEAEQGDEVVSVEVGVGPPHRCRLRRLAPPWFCPIRSGRCELISQTTASASGTGIAIVSSNISLALNSPRRLLIAASWVSSPRTLMNTAGLSMCSRWGTGAAGLKGN